ncbi:MAG: adenylate kinase family protein [Promethearchaeota archaeon]
MKTIVISGTPGCGKTSVSKKIAERVNVKIISLNKLAISKHLSLDYDSYRETYIVETKSLIPLLKKEVERIKKKRPDFLIIEGHFSDIVPESYINYVFILRCDPDELKKRLEKKGYKIKKIRENIQAEILGNCVNYFIQKRMKIPLIEIDTTNISIENIAKIIIEILVKNKNVDNHKVGNVDWLEKIFRENRLKEFFD